jgi:hypothetical protein
VLRPPNWVCRFAREDDGLTAVEYAVLVGLVITIGGVAAFWLGRGVNKSSGHVAWFGDSGGSAYIAHAPATTQKLIVSIPPSAARGSARPWILLTIGSAVAFAGGFVGWLYLRDRIRHAQTRRRVRQSLSDAGGQSALERLVRQTSRRPAMRVKKLDTHLIGRHGPELHRLLREREPSALARAIDPAISNRPAPSPSPAVPVVG